MLAALAPFLGISALVIVSPGPDTVIVLRNSLWGGRRAGVSSALGVVTGLITWTIAASIGVAALIRASEPAFLALKLVGAAYLICLGGSSLLAAMRTRSGQLDDRHRPLGVMPMRAAYRQGLISNLGNPKIAVFFTTFLPQFVPGRSASFAALLGLGLIFCAITISWLLLYAVVAARIAAVLRRRRVQSAIDALTGTVLVGFGLRLAGERP
ncbi:MAG: LysE family translocator [Candidatus Dormibacteria bacterium]